MSNPKSHSWLTDEIKKSEFKISAITLYIWSNNADRMNEKWKTETLWAVSQLSSVTTRSIIISSEKKSWVIIRANQINTIDADRVYSLRKVDEKLYSAYFLYFLRLIFCCICYDSPCQTRSTNRQTTTAKLLIVQRIMRSWDARLTVHRWPMPVILLKYERIN